MHLVVLHLIILFQIPVVIRQLRVIEEWNILLIVPILWLMDAVLRAKAEGEIITQVLAHKWQIGACLQSVIS